MLTVLCRCKNYIFIWAWLCVVQAPPTVKTPEKSHEDEEAMPPYDPDTQTLIDGWFCCQSYSSIRYREICLYSSSCSLFSSANQLFSGSQLLRRPEMTLRRSRNLFGRWTIKSGLFNAAIFYETVKRSWVWNQVGVQRTGFSYAPEILIGQCMLASEYAVCSTYGCITCVLQCICSVLWRWCVWTLLLSTVLSFPFILLQKYWERAVFWFRPWCWVHLPVQPVLRTFH